MVVVVMRIHKDRGRREMERRVRVRDGSDEEWGERAGERAKREKEGEPRWYWWSYTGERGCIRFKVLFF